MGGVLRTLCYVAVAAGAVALVAGPAVAADLQISPSRDEILVTPARSQSVELVVSNNGPESVDGVAVTGRTVDLAMLRMEITDPSRCVGGALEIVGAGMTLRWRVGTLANAAAASCTVSFQAASGAPSSSLLYVAEVAAPGNIDNDSFNSFSRTTVSFSGIDAPVDVRLAARLDPGGILRQGFSQRLRVTVTNVGSTVVPAVTVLSPGYNQAAGFIGFTGYDLFEVTETAPCFMIVDAEPPFVFFVALGFDDAPLPPGASRTCTVGIRALPGALGVGMAELPLDLFPRGTGVYDIAPQDNSAIVRVDYGTIPPRAVPLSRAAWFIAIASIALLGVWAARRRDRERKADGLMRQA